MYFVFKAEFSYKSNQKFLDQFQYCEENSIPYAIIIGENELKANSVKLRQIVSRKEVFIFLLFFTLLLIFNRFF